MKRDYVLQSRVNGQVLAVTEQHIASDRAIWDGCTCYLQSVYRGVIESRDVYQAKCNSLFMLFCPFSVDEMMAGAIKEEDQQGVKPIWLAPGDVVMGTLSSSLPQQCCFYSLWLILVSVTVTKLLLATRTDTWPQWDLGYILCGSLCSCLKSSPGSKAPKPAGADDGCAQSRRWERDASNRVPTICPRKSGFYLHFATSFTPFYHFTYCFLSAGTGKLCIRHFQTEIGVEWNMQFLFSFSEQELCTGQTS